LHPVADRPEAGAATEDGHDAGRRRVEFTEHRYEFAGVGGAEAGQS
jgi:hypothetical protein